MTARVATPPRFVCGFHRWWRGSLALGLGLAVASGGAAAEWLHQFLGSGGGRMSAGEVVVETTVGEWGGGQSAVAPSVTLRGGFLGQLNEPPHVAPVVLHRPPRLSTKQRAARVLAAAWDPEDDPLTLAAVGPASAGGLTLLENGWLLYAPPPDDGEDQFAYVVVDAEGAEAGETVYVVRDAPGDAPSLNHLGVPVVLSDGSLLLRFIGIAGRAYTIEYTDQLGDPWQPLLPAPGTVVAGPTGVIEAIDAHPSSGQRFYRTVVY